MPSVSSDQSSLQNFNVGTGEEMPTKLQFIASIESEFFTYETLVRPDRTVVIHLRKLRQDFRNRRMFEYLTKWIRDRIGGHRAIYADFIGNVVSGMPSERNNTPESINSLDLFVYDYVPALMHDERFVTRHLTDLGQKLIVHIRGQM
jgi:hypothetical protein